ncbi:MULTISPECIES: bacteriocin immunity protein [unclassified Escherichia]|uniref:bacteriocin immunity protein n=1 Tax=unclassified Escherichia TaxID=2608889 RepID=UPI00102949F4|nr:MULTISPECIES: bacteriocin immunity protein [unclassified Escherichia]TGB62124.1 bacteriocin immunity protein [Escherichia coli]RZM89492.1 bacteriocin immunity protein [Escherichia sp. E1V33]RZM91985.1 bacteriocin immunity protein [Escherichia sp. E14V5]RZN00729.1 bacteriocin immunity protein [Escherichia sp. E14V7]RZN16935.1 bacteriocin immunity protein [Escherichia sp. E14S1]
MFEFMRTFNDYTENEFLEFLHEFRKATRKDKFLKGKELDTYLDKLMYHFIVITEHPKQGDLIAYPESPEDGNPNNIIKIVRVWRKSQGLPLFKDSEADS